MNGKRRFFLEQAKRRKKSIKVRKKIGKKNEMKIRETNKKIIFITNNDEQQRRI